MNADGPPRVPVPPEFDLEDRLAGALTFRHLAYLSAAGCGIALAVFNAGTPPLVATGVLLALAGGIGAAWRPAGRPLDAWLRPAVAYARRTGRLHAPALPWPRVPAVVRHVEVPRLRVRRPAWRLPRLRPTRTHAAVAGAAVLIALAAVARPFAHRHVEPPARPVDVTAPVPWPSPAWPEHWISEEEIDHAIDEWLAWLDGH